MTNDNNIIIITKSIVRAHNRRCKFFVYSLIHLSEPTIHYCVYVVSTQNQYPKRISPAHISQTCRYEFRLNIMLPCTTTSPKWSLPCGFHE
jgi:hypothetical protein